MGEKNQAMLEKNPSNLKRQKVPSYEMQAMRGDESNEQSPKTLFYIVKEMKIIQ